MPELSDLQPTLTANLLLNRVFLDAGLKRPTARAMHTGLVRLADRLVIEYELARSALRAYVESPKRSTLQLLRASGHLETCITSHLRLANYLEEDAWTGTQGAARVLTPNPAATMQFRSAAAEPLHFATD